MEQLSVLQTTLRKYQKPIFYGLGLIPILYFVKKLLDKMTKDAIYRIIHDVPVTNINELPLGILIGCICGAIFSIFYL